MSLTKENAQRSKQFDMSNVFIHTGDGSRCERLGRGGCSLCGATEKRDWSVSTNGSIRIDGLKMQSKFDEMKTF